MTGRRYDVEITAPGAKEIRVRQVNNGGDKFLKSHLGQRIKVKTHKRQKNAPVTVPQLKIQIFWKKAEGGGSEWLGPVPISGNQTLSFKSPVARGAAPPPPAGAQPTQPPAPPASIPIPPGADVFVPGYQQQNYQQQQYPPAGGGYETSSTDAGGFPWGWAALGLGGAMAGLTGVVVVKRRRAQGA